MMVSALIPVLETSRLVLRGPESRDFDGYAAFWAGPRAKPFGGPFSRRAAWDSFLTLAGHWLVRGFGQWIVEIKADKKAAGWVGFFMPDHYQEPELGWSLFDGYEGQGFAAEAAIAARDHGAAHFGIQAPASYIVAGNARSIALAERLDARCEATLDHGDGPFHIYRHPAPARQT